MRMRREVKEGEVGGMERWEFMKFTKDQERQRNVRQCVESVCVCVCVCVCVRARARARARNAPAYPSWTAIN
jgi:hypothetical protein